MSKSIYINKELFIVNTNEYNNTQKIYKSLKIYEDLGLHERLISLVKKLTKCFTTNYNELLNLIMYNCTHGGYIPIKLNNYFNQIYLCNTNKMDFDNIIKNTNLYNITNITFTKTFENTKIIQKNKNIILIPIFTHDVELDLKFIMSNIFDSNIIIVSNETKILDEKFKFKYTLSNTNYCIYLNQNEIFNETFKYYFNNNDNNVIYYDNLINLCVMVKNGGDNFKNFLKSNMNLIDKWTILDTGSTDNTIDIINEILVDKKDGKLYQEPFINFRDSRNRLLDLADEECKFTIMLDDTYLVKGKLREFLNFVRGDQYSSSFSIHINNNDIEYSSNRILKSQCKLRYVYKIHEVISEKDNIIVNIPCEISNIFDDNPEYLQKRTLLRLQSDLKLLYEELEEDPNNPRTYYYLGQTYNLLEDYNNSYKYFLKRYEFKNSGLIQERFSAILRAGRIANYNLNLKWEICEDLYLKATKIDESRPEPLYFIGIHYYLKNDYTMAFYYLKKAFELGVPIESQYDLIINLYYHYIPKFIAKIAYGLNEYAIGEKASDFFISYSNNTKTSDYQEILSWNKIYKKLNMYKEKKQIKIYPHKPIFCFVADGGFNEWTGSDIKNKGVGGSETYIIEMARNIQKSGLYQTYVFSNTPNNQEEIFENTIYKSINSYYEFVNTTYIQHCLISRFSEYLPLTFKGYTENVYLVIHDLTPTGNVIPIDPKLKQIFCLTEWHVNYFITLYPQLKNITVPFYYGCSFNTNTNFIKNNKIPKSFIYSSYPNRGLLELLKMWPDIYKSNPGSTLNIYSDIYNKWSNDTEPEKMQQIKNLMLKYKLNSDSMGINYYGWVNKNILKKAWETADIWFYPCTFIETFCLTALEAARTKTFVITNNLGALTNTVGNRGIIIKGNPESNTWKKDALDKINYYLNENNNLEKKTLIEKNYYWASKLTWENQATEFLNQYIIKNNMEYKNKFDIISTNNEYSMVNNVLNNFILTNPKIKKNDEIKILDIYTHTGINLIHFVKTIPNSIGIGINCINLLDSNLNPIDIIELEKSFNLNKINSDLDNKISLINNNCLNQITEFVKTNEKFDLIYIGLNDNSHQLYTLIMLGWELLNPYGFLGISYCKKLEKNINQFIRDFKPNYKIINSEYKVWIEKI